MDERLPRLIPQLHFLESDYSDDLKNRWSAHVADFVVHSSADTIRDTDLVYCHGNLLNAPVRRFLNRNQPAFYAARGYLGNQHLKHRNWWRITVNGWANIVAHSPPWSRWDSLGIERHPWKVKTVRNVLIAPSKMTTKYWCGLRNHQWATQLMEQFPGAEIRVRSKPRKAGARYATLWQDLDWADLVVSISSAITCEAFWYGKKVISLEPCPTWITGMPNLDDWQNPDEPALRDAWHEHVAWSQFTSEEIHSGEALSLCQRYHGDPGSLEPVYSYRLR